MTNTNRMRIILGLLATAAVLVVLWGAFVFGHVALAQGGASTQGLPARYVAAFSGAGIETGALLGPFCKSAAVDTGTNILTITCEDDDDPPTPTR